jgi:hypothetical protein
VPADAIGVGDRDTDLPISRWTDGAIAGDPGAVRCGRNGADTNAVGFPGVRTRWF